jgi:hypothetical protein
MLDAYRGQRWTESMDALAEARASLPSGLGIEELFEIFKRRIAEYTAKPPDPGWDGVAVALEK